MYKVFARSIPAASVHLQVYLIKHVRATVETGVAQISHIDIVI